MYSNRVAISNTKIRNGTKKGWKIEAQSRFKILTSQKSNIKKKKMTTPIDNETEKYL